MVGKVILDVDAVSPQGVIDRRVLTADVDAGFGLITCEEVFQPDGQTAFLQAKWHTGCS